MQMRPSAFPGHVSVSLGCAVCDAVHAPEACAHHSTICRWFDPPQPGWQSGTVTRTVLAAGEHCPETCSQSVTGALSCEPSGASVPAASLVAVTPVHVPAAAAPGAISADTPASASAISANRMLRAGVKPILAHSSPTDSGGGSELQPTRRCLASP